MRETFDAMRAGSAAACECRLINSPCLRFRGMNTRAGRVASARRRKSIAPSLDANAIETAPDPASVACSTALALVRVIPAYLPLVDFPQHVALHAIWNNIHDPAFNLGGRFRVVLWSVPCLPTWPRTRRRSSSARRAVCAWCCSSRSWPSLGRRWCSCARWAAGEIALRFLPRCRSSIGTASSPTSSPCR